MLAVAPTIKPYADGADMRGVAMNMAFPTFDPEFKPFGSKILVQLRRVQKITSSGIILVEESKDTEAWNTQVGKIIALGALAFKNRATGQPWPEGTWANVGDYVRFPRHVGDRQSYNLDDGQEPVVVIIMDDHNLMGAYTGDPMTIRAFHR